jgi:potassium/hydrogen antiporter
MKKIRYIPQVQHTFTYFLIASSTLLLLSVLASKASGALGIPSLVVFIAVGMLAGSDGPGGIYFDDPQLAQALGILALIFILFAGGLETVWSEARPMLGSALALSTLTVLGTTVLVGWFATLAFGFNWLEGILLGAIVSSTDAAAVFSVLDGKTSDMTGSIKPLLELESGSNDPMAAFLTVGLVQILAGHGDSVWSLVPKFIQQMTFGIGLGLLIGKAASTILNRVKLESEGLYPVATTALCLFSYGIAEVLGGSGFLAVYVVGIVMGNSKLVHKKALMLFHNGLAWLMQIIMFIALGLLVFPSKLLPVASTALILAVFLILVARPLSVYVALARSKLNMQEKAIISWIGLRGAVPIVLATYPQLARIPKAELIFDVVFFIVLTSVVIQGTTIPFICKWLKTAPKPGIAEPIQLT